MSIETARSFFLWCSLINYALLLAWVVIAKFGRDWLCRLTNRFLRVTPEQLDLINVAGMSLYKIGIILFNIVPCIAFHIVS